MKTCRIIVLLLVVSASTACNLTLPAAHEGIASSPSKTVPAPAISEKADLIFINGNLLTMDDAYPSAEAIALRGDKILSVGTNEDTLSKRAENTIVIDLAGRTMLPGFIDSHNHRLGDYSMAGYSNLEEVIPDTIAQGWTTLDELFVDQARLDALKALDEGGKLQLRVNAYLPANTPQGERLGNWYSAYSPKQYYSPRVRVAGLKIYMDIKWGQKIHWSQEELNGFVLQSNQAGWPIAVHTIGSESHAMLLTAFENEYGTTSQNPLRNRIEHMLSVTPEQLGRIRRLNLIASIQFNMPGEFIGDPAFDSFVTRESQAFITPWRSILMMGIPVAGGSDWPYYYSEESGAPFGSPLRLIYQAVTRVGNKDVQPYPWMLDQTITAAEALRALTIGGAYAVFEENSKGSLTAGKLADLVILSDDPLTVPTDDIENIHVLMTMIGGKVEYCAAADETFCAEKKVATPPAAVNNFAGTWEGTDADDGSLVTVVLTQIGNDLTGTFKDSYSSNTQKPGYQGNGIGIATSESNAEMKFDLTRSDGKSLSTQFRLALSNENNTLTILIEGATPIVLNRRH